MAGVWIAQRKSFIITGGANGLGAAYVEAFLKEGAKNVAILDIAEEAGIALSQKMNKMYNDKTIFIKCDVSKEENINQAFGEVLEKFKQMDVIINNAGVMDDSERVWRNACDINYSATAAVIKMFNQGSSGSVWLSAGNRPAEDITHVINKAYSIFENLALNGLDALSS